MFGERVGSYGEGGGMGVDGGLLIGLVIFYGFRGFG